MTSKIDLYASGASSTVSLVWLVVIPTICCVKVSVDRVSFAFLRDSTRPAPCDEEHNELGLPLPLTMNEPSLMFPGMIPSMCSAACVAPFL